MQHLKLSPLKGLLHCQTSGLQKNHAKRHAQEMIATNIYSCEENLPRTEIIFVYAKKKIVIFTMYKMRRRTKVPYLCDKSTKFCTQTVGRKFFCQTLSRRHSTVQSRRYLLPALASKANIQRSLVS